MECNILFRRKTSSLSSFWLVKFEELVSFKSFLNSEARNNGKFICINLDDIRSGDLKSQMKMAFFSWNKTYIS